MIPALMDTMRPIALWLTAMVLLIAPARMASGGEIINREVIEDPRHAGLDDESMAHWERLFSMEQRWIGRDLAFLEQHHPGRILSLLSARLLYRGGAWGRKIFMGGKERWTNVDREVRLTVLRCLRYHREAALGDVYCAFLARETDPQLASSALVNLHLVDREAATSWALRLADPRHPARLPASQDIGVRTHALALLVESHRSESAEMAPEVRPALMWALNASGIERAHALRLLPRGAVPDLLTQVILRLEKEHRAGVLDEDGRFSLVLATTRLTGNAGRELVDALMSLAVKGDRALAAAAATALSSGVSWEVAIAINDLAERAAGDPDPVIRQTLMALLVRLDPAAVSRAAGTGSPWTRLADHVSRLQEWDALRAGE